MWNLCRVNFRRFSSVNFDLNYLLQTMPKDVTQHVERNQKQRMKIKEKSKFYSPGVVNCQILGNGARGGSSSVYIFSEQSRYLFNCSEGTQRLSAEHKTKLTRMENLFLTRKTWNRFGGVPGLCLTLQDFGVPNLQIHGPPGINEIFKSTKRFVVLRHMRVETPKCYENEFFEDSVMRVTYVPIKKDEESILKRVISEESLRTINDNTDYYAYENKNCKKNGIVNEQVDDFLPEVEDTVMSYICKLRERPGQLMLEKCVELGVPKGPLLGQLKNGIDVTLPNGKIVKADDVRGPTMPGSVFIFIDIPDESYLNSLQESKAYENYQSNAENEENVALVVFHFSSPEIVKNSIYKEWMDKFSSKTKHLMVNESNNITGFFSAHQSQRRLELIDENIFPKLKEENPILNFFPLPDNFKELKIEVPKDEKVQFPELHTLTSFHVRPADGFDRSSEPFYNKERLLDCDFQVDEELQKSIENFKTESSKIVKKRSSIERSQEFPKIVTLGTGSCIPNKTRNVSSNLIHASNETCYLLDCGEGTLGQIIRFYGREEADEVLKKLKMIYISHLHADHHLGLFNILEQRRKVTNDKVVIVAPAQMNSWLSFYNYCIEDISDTFDFCSNTEFISFNVNDEQKSTLLERLKMTNLETCWVKHCPHSFGISFSIQNLMRNDQFPNEIVKITYSGDTMPCDDLVVIGKNSDILIHEATMEDELEQEAKIKMHSTVSQAIKIGKSMNAKFVILTHFSQRYAKIPIIDKIENNVAIAFDNMEVTLNDLPMMHLMYEPLKLMFSEHFEALEKKSAKRKFVQDLHEIQNDLKNKNYKSENN